MIQEIEIDEIRYKVRNDYLHRGANPRLVLQEKFEGKFVCVQFDNKIDSEKVDVSRDYKGYWVTKHGHNEIKIKFTTLK